MRKEQPAEACSKLALAPLAMRPAAGNVTEASTRRNLRTPILIFHTHEQIPRSSASMHLLQEHGAAMRQAVHERDAR